ncbi:YhjD/YihY/BrkB family envelope integrity protein [Streptomyces sp. NPDC018610]|uniref:YhjD/YihY/BrkB family envelope integrity protein n=1 Tax=Streptomyces sp. NPDC018610 TaxID=3365049 RepID=UPI00379EF34B
MGRFRIPTPGDDRPKAAWSRGLLDRRRAWGRRLSAGTAGRLRRRLGAADVFGHAFQLAALAFLCFFPFLILLTTAVGQDTAEVLTGWLGLDQKAGRAVAALFRSGSGSSTLTFVSAVLLIAGVAAVAGTLQSWYQFLFDVRPRRWPDLGAQLAWLTLLVAYSAVQTRVDAALPALPLKGLCGFVLALFFWWGTLWLLLAGSVAWRFLLPAAVATDICWTGLGLFSSRFFSATVVANSQKYGPVGVVMVILSWLVAVGVVVQLGAVVGREYAERRAGAPAR